MSGVLVTGAGGFIGSHAIDSLVERGAEVHAITTREAPATRPGVRFHRVDLLNDYGALSRCVSDIQPTHLLHLAWYAVPGRFWTSLENYRWVGATMELARMVTDNGGSRMVSAGTCAEYQPGPEPCHEDRTPIAPATPYGVAKDATHRLLESYGTETALNVAWGRIFFTYGPREARERLVPSVVQSLLAGQPARCSEGMQVRDFLHVRDVADAFVALLFSNLTGAVNIASGEPVTIRDVVARIGRQLGAPDLLRFGALPTRDEPAVIVGDNRRLQSEVGWRPRFDLDEGLQDTIAWWRAR